MIEIIREVKKQDMQNLQNIDNDELNVRVGIHTGKVLAGIIGSKVVKYDVFGDTILIASKIKNFAPPGKVCIS